MTEPVDRSDKGFVEHWRRVGPILEGIRRSESLCEHKGTDNMETIVITLPELVLRKLQERSREANVAPEELVCACVEEWLHRPKDDFADAASYVLQKNSKHHQRLKADTPSKGHCCDMIRQQCETRCEVHADRFDCPDCLITYSERLGGYGLIIHDGGSSFVRINYCPWCGCKLSENVPDANLGEA
jgi:hypothetical protein